ncbi:MAG: hypothetical protein JRG83_15120 [Deltaproteobacteria bacterium]|nr:hypothetical protein [Deltaproteobacteria bacterium]
MGRTALNNWRRLQATILAATLTLAPVVGHAQEGDDVAELGAKLANPLSDVWALFTEFDFIWNGGRLEDGDIDRPTYSAAFQPILPISLTDDYRLIARPTVPIVWSAPVPGPGTTGVDFDRNTGLGDTTLLLLAARKEPYPLFGGGVMAALGTSLYFPTATDDDLGAKQWGMGPAAALVWKNELVTVGFSPKYFWEYASEDTRRPDLNQGEILYFFFLNLPNAWQIGFAPKITYDHRAEPHNKWNLPVGVTVAKTTKVASQAVKFQLGLEYSVVSQDDFGKRLLLKFNVIPVIAPLIKGNIF